MTVLTRPTTLLILIAVVHAFAVVPASIRLHILAMTGLTALGAGELMVTLVQLLKRDPARTMVPSILVSAGGFIGSASIHFESSAVVFTTAMLLVVAGILTAQRIAADATEL